MQSLTDVIVELARKGLAPAAILEELAARGRPTTIGFITKTLSDKRKTDPSIPVFNKPKTDMDSGGDMDEGSPSSQSTLGHRRSLTHDFLSEIMTRAQQREDIFSRVGMSAFVMANGAGPMTEAEREHLLNLLNEPDLEKAARGVDQFVRARLGPLVDAKNREPTESPLRSDPHDYSHMENLDIKHTLPMLTEYRKLLKEHPHDKRFDERLDRASKTYPSPQFQTFLLLDVRLFLFGVLGIFPEMDEPSLFWLEEGLKPLNL